jgi:hypothetical protein
MALDNTKEKFNEIRSVLLAWLEDISDFPVVIAEESDPRPNQGEPHVAFKILTNLVKLGSRDEHRPATATTEYKVVSHREFTVSITAVGSPVSDDEDLDDKVRATDILNEIQLSLERPTVLDRFTEIDLAVVSEGTVVDTSLLLETETEPRATLDVIFRVRIDVEDDPGIIEKTRISGEIDSNMDGSFDKTIPEFEVP